MTCIAFDPMDMAHILKAMSGDTVVRSHAMGCRSRDLAYEWFGVQRFVTDFGA